MANLFKLKTFDGSSTDADVQITAYTTPASTTAVVIGLTVSNTSNAEIAINVKIDNSDGDEVFLVKGAPIPVGSAIEIMDGNKIILETGDSIYVYSDTTNSVDVLVSVMEQS